MPAKSATLERRGRPAPRLPYGRHWVDDQDAAAVLEVLRSDWLTTGPKLGEFEQALAAFVGTREAVAVSSGTAALHAIMFAAGIRAGDEVIVPPLTFAATANAVVYQGGVPVFADVSADTLLLDPACAEAAITPRTRAIVAVDYAGQPCDYDALREIADRHGLALLADACHALGGRYRGRAVCTLADLSAFSFHPVKHITTGEGGAVVTRDRRLAERMRVFRNHGITCDHHQRERQGSWFYKMAELGFNYRLSDLHCALGISQLRKLPDWLERRRAIARHYDAALSELAGVEPLGVRADVSPAWHLYVIRLDAARGAMPRDAVFKTLRAAGIGVNVHYVPVHLHPFYQKRFGTRRGLCPQAERASDEILSLPIFPAMSEADVEDVIQAVRDAIGEHR